MVCKWLFFFLFWGRATVDYLRRCHGANHLGSKYAARSGKETEIRLGGAWTNVLCDSESKDIASMIG